MNLKWWHLLSDISNPTALWRWRGTVYVFGTAMVLGLLALAYEWLRRTLTLNWPPL